MNTSCLRLVPLLFCFMLVTSGLAADQGPFALGHSFFDPGTNAQFDARQGYSLAIDGNIVITGTPYDDVGGFNSGVVKVYNAATGALLHTLTNPTPASDDGFGWSVAVSGTRVVVGAPFDDTKEFEVGSAYLYDLAGATPAIPIMTLENPSPAANSQFGTSVAISGTSVVVGAPSDNTGASEAGSAYVYDLGSATPAVMLFAFTNPSPAPYALFGEAVAISGTRIVVGALFDDTGARDAGIAYVYDLAGATPTIPITTLTNPSPAEAEYFGSSVAVFGTHVVVGSPFDDMGAISAGSAYVYDLAGPTPGTPLIVLTNPSPAAYAQFGQAVAVSGTRVIVGGMADDSGVIRSGIAYVYDLTSATPTVPQTTLTNPSPADYDVFGLVVAMSGTRVVVGAQNDDTGANDAGSAYVYDLASTTPTSPLSTLSSPSPAAEDLFGYSVAVSGTRLVVGALGDDTGAFDAGRAYVYDLASATPKLPVATLTNPSPVEFDNFGQAVAIAGSRLIIGEPNDNRAYVYDLDGAMPTRPVVTLTNPGPVLGDNFGSSVSISGTRAVIGAPSSGHAYVYDLAGPSPGNSIAILANPNPLREDRFAVSVAISGTYVAVGADWDDTGAANAGSAYVYDLAGAAPTVPVATLRNPSPDSEDYFGVSVAISGTRVVVGAYQDSNLVGASGGAYVYDLASAVPTAPIASLMNPDPAQYDYFGYSVAISGTHVAVGAHRDGTRAPEAGTVYVYDLSSVTPNVPVASLTKPSPAAGDQFGYSVAIDGTTIVAGAPYDDTSAADRGAAYVFGLRPTLSIAPAAPGLATISWMPATWSGFVLQYTDSLSPANWLYAPSGAPNPVTISTTNASRFYRLFQP